ncbi:MAG: hypothetical protein ACYS4W_06860 [Planctomycetota bacterium]|jgi:hypothetical protein
MSRLFTVVLLGILLITTYGCKNGSPGSEHAGESEGEEPGLRLAINETYDVIRKGVRLILAYDNTSSSFIGTVENVTNQTVFSVRVEVHLSNGVELGPTSPNDLGPGNKSSVKLSAAGQSFTWWKAHAQTSGPGGEGGGEHRHGHLQISRSEGRPLDNGRQHALTK